MFDSRRAPPALLGLQGRNLLFVGVHHVASIHTTVGKKFVETANLFFPMASRHF